MPAFLSMNKVYSKFCEFFSVPDSVVYNPKTQRFESKFGSGNISNFEEFASSIDERAMNDKLTMFATKIMMLPSSPNQPPSKESSQVRTFRPISEIHEDHGDVLLLRLTDENRNPVHEPPQAVAVNCANGTDFTETDWDCFLELDWNQAFEVLEPKQ